MVRQDEEDPRQLERAQQYLAIPLRGFAPVHVQTLWRLQHWRRHSVILLLCCALVASLAAAWLVLTTPPSQIYEDASGVHIESLLLVATSPSPRPGYAFFKGDASLLVADAGNIERATAATVLNGKPTAGSCFVRKIGHGTLTGLCTFRIGSRRLTSQDVYDSHARRWTRRYSDGVATEFGVPAAGSVIPIPLPLGH